MMIQLELYKTSTCIGRIPRHTKCSLFSNSSDVRIIKTWISNQCIPIIHACSSQIYTWRLEILYGSRLRTRGKEGILLGIKIQKDNIHYGNLNQSIPIPNPAETIPYISSIYSKITRATWTLWNKLEYNNFPDIIHTWTMTSK